MSITAGLAASAGLVVTRNFVLLLRLYHGVTGTFFISPHLSQATERYRHAPSDDITIRSDKKSSTPVDKDSSSRTSTEFVLLADGRFLVFYSSADRILRFTL